MPMYRFSVLIAGSLFASGLFADYQSHEFNDPNSSIAMMYQCVVVGDKEGYASDTLLILGKSLDSFGISIEKSGVLLNDAYKWYDSNRDMIDFHGLWKSLCEIPIDNLRRMVN